MQETCREEGDVKKEVETDKYKQSTTRDCWQSLEVAERHGVIFSLQDPSHQPY